MQIIDDQIEFTVDDFAGFSEPVKKALAGYLEDYSTYFASVVNVSVAAAKQHAKNLAANDPAVNVILENFAAADEAKRAAAEPLIADLNAFLKVS